MGDIEILSENLNARVGYDNNDYEKVIENPGISKINENGELGNP